MKIPSIKLDKLFLPLLLVATLIPLCCLLIHFYFNLQELQLTQERFDHLRRRSITVEKEHHLNHFFLNEIKNADHFYIDKHLEPLAFLESEVKCLQGYAYQVEQNGFIKERINFLQNNNRLLYAEETIQRGGIFQEVYERQQKPIEINEEDLKKLLSLIEGVSIDAYHPQEGRPQLIIKEFDLSKKIISSQEKVFVLTTQLLKREQLTQ